MACTPPNIPTKVGIIGQPSPNGAQRRREYSVQRTGNELVDRNLDQIRQALRETGTSLGIVENLIPGLVAASGTATGVDSGGDLTNVSIINLTAGTLRFVDTFRSFFRLDPLNLDGWTPDGISYIAALGGVGIWIRVALADPFWATQTDWYIDPAGIGDDENSGLTAAAPLLTMAEWRRRVKGAVYTGVTRVVIHALSSSTTMDDGLLEGFTTEGIASGSSVVIVGTPTVVGTGTITAYAPYSGNTRGQITDSAIPVSWTASGFVCTSSASRFIRKAGGGSVPYASLLKDLGSKTIQMGIVSNWNDTNTTSITFTETNFTNGDSYEVVSMTRWPKLHSNSVNVRYQCLDIFTTTVTRQQDATEQNNFALCGFVGDTTFQDGNSIQYNCAFLASFVLGTVGPVNCSFLNTLVQPKTPDTWKTLTNVMVGCQLYIEHGNILGDTGTLRIFDTAFPCLQCSTKASTNIFSIVGEGNTGKLVYVDRGSQIYGGGNVTATTSDPLPYYVSGVSYATPVVNAGDGAGIYN